MEAAKHLPLAKSEPERIKILICKHDGTREEAKVGIEHLDSPDSCDFLFNNHTKTLIPTKDILCKGIKITLDSGKPSTLEGVIKNIITRLEKLENS
jgi:hypothetical protein